MSNPEHLTQLSGKPEHTYPYRAWWGLAGCAVIMGVIMLLGPYHTFEIQPRQFTFDYPWKLPDPSVWTRAVVWTMYALHQIGIWALIYKAQSMQLSYVKGLHRVNLQALALNVGFAALHIAQTKLTYDGLAQDVPEVSAFASVALMLFVILLMENDRRGLILGKRVPMPLGVGQFARKYHGYFFSWAITYTFWYHPIEVTPGHLMGLFYMFMLFLQGSLFLTRYHVNRWWTLTLEFFMVVHGFTVAWAGAQGLNGQWAHFLFGGMAVFLLTQMHGVPFRRWQKLAMTSITLVGGVWFYALNMDQLQRLPGAILSRYAAVLVCVIVIWLIMRPFIWSGKLPQPTR